MTVDPKCGVMALASLLKKEINNMYQVHIWHAGVRNGFVSGMSLIFVLGTKSGDYHNLMNRENFEHWMLTQLLPSLEKSSVIVMDNAP
jgi:hypothetical protein